jgi:flagellin
VISGPGFSSGAGGAITVNTNLSSVSDSSTLVNAINAAIQGAGQASTAQSDAFKGANIQAIIHTGTDGHQQLMFVSSNTAFQVTAGDQTANGFLGNLGTNTAGSATSATSTPETVAHSASFIAGGTQQISGASSAGLTFTTLNYSSAAAVDEAQTLTFSIADSTGTPQTTKVTLSGDAGTANVTAAVAVNQINAALQQTGNAALQSIVASVDGANSTISFSSNSQNKFNVNIGQESTSTTVGTNGFANPNTIVTSALVGVGATSDLSTQSGAQAAVSALSNAVTALGSAQAVVGRGENQFNYAINLAQSQVTNLSTAESRIRDADLASEAANLTKAQILMQAGVAALAQANAAPQAVLSLLK